MWNWTILFPKYQLLIKIGCLDLSKLTKEITKYYGSPKPLPKLSFSAPSGRRGCAVERIKYAFLIHIVIFITK